MSMDYWYSHIIQKASLYLPHLKRRLILPHGIDTQENKPVFLGFMIDGTGSIHNEHWNYGPTQNDGVYSTSKAYDDHAQESYQLAHISVYINGS